MNPDLYTVLLVAIAVAAFLSTLCGGLLALRLRDKLHLILGFSAGAVIGVAFFDLLPEAINFGAQIHDAAAVLSFSAVGFLFYLVMDRILLFHGEGAAGAAASRGGFAAGILCVHSLLDGVAIGLAFQASHQIGVVVAIAVLTHDFSDGINTMNIILKNGGGRPAGISLAIGGCLGTGGGRRFDVFFYTPRQRIRHRVGIVRRFLFIHRRQRFDSRKLPRAPEVSHHGDDIGGRRRSLSGHRADRRIATRAAPQARGANPRWRRCRPRRS